MAKHLSIESGDKSNPTLSSIPSQDKEKESETVQIPTAINEGRLSSIDVLNLPQDLGKRRRMCQFHPSDRDIVRRSENIIQEIFVNLININLNSQSLGQKTIDLVRNGLINTKHGLNIVLLRKMQLFVLLVIYSRMITLDKILL